MNETCDVTIIGAGVMGAALAHDLAERGRRVVVLDRSTICSGSSGVNAGGVRHQFTAEVNIMTATRSIQRIATFEEEFGVDVGFRRVGYLFLVTRAESERMFKEAVDLQRSCGLPSEFLSPLDINELIPIAFTDDLIGGAFCPADGHLDPHALVAGFASAARRRGGMFRQNCAVTGFEVASDRIVSVRTSHGDEISSSVVVNAAGPWAAEIAGMAGVELEISPWHSQIFHIEGADGLPKTLPMTIDFDNGKCYFRREGEGLLAGTDDGWARGTEWPVAFDDTRAPALVDRLVHRCPRLESARLKGGWAGLLEITPDENPIVGWTGPSNLYTAAGFSGHGLSIAPGLAYDVARDVCGEVTELSLSDYRPERFHSAATRAESLSLR